MRVFSASATALWILAASSATAVAAPQAQRELAFFDNLEVSCSPHYSSFLKITVVDKKAMEEAETARRARNFAAIPRLFIMEMHAESPYHPKKIRDLADTT